MMGEEEGGVHLHTSLNVDDLAIDSTIVRDLTVDGLDALDRHA